MSGRKRKNVGQSQDENPIAWRRERNEESKRRRMERDDFKPAIYATEFSKDEIAAEERRPKRKVAVMMGYSGTGYHGMQLSHNQRTIEGDLFQALVKAGAVSKANADDPKKLSFARCARTDKGVHAAGNIVSLKLIIDDENIVEKINSSLCPQIRVWGIERTGNSFSAYTQCDSRIYEYLIPTHCFLPPHPKTYMGRKLLELADEMGDMDGHQQRQSGVTSFWKQAEEEHIIPAMTSIDPKIRDIAYQRVFETGDTPETGSSADDEGAPVNLQGSMTSNAVRESSLGQRAPSTRSPKPVQAQAQTHSQNTATPNTVNSRSTINTPLDQAVRHIKAAVLAAKKSWRICPERLERVESALSQFVGVQNYHNYTVQKNFKDPSAKRVIKSFFVSGRPILIGDSEWLSMKVHGQSFMMHQIRKMVGMAALAVRCGSDLRLLKESMGAERLSIPRAPGLGLLLERPIFDAYNQKSKTQQGAPDRNEVAFERYKHEMDKFKEEEIYARIYREEEEGDVFHQLFWAVDQLRDSQFLYLSSKGLGAVDRSRRQ